jgi:alpha,alpha-trehalase
MPRTDGSLRHEQPDGGRASSWSLVYRGYRPEEQGLREALCTLGNGYMATRGAAPDASADAVHYPGTYLAGGYNRLSTRIGDRDIENEALVNQTNWLPLTFRIDEGDRFRLDRVEVLDYCQELDLADGILRRDFRIRDDAGRCTRWSERRLVSMADPHLAALEVTLTAENWSGRLTLQSALDGTVRNDGVARYRGLSNRHLDFLGADRPADDTILLHTRTNQSRLEVATAARTRCWRNGEAVAGERRTDAHQGWIGQDIAVEMREGDGLAVEKVATVRTGRDRAISEAASAAAEKAVYAGRFEALAAAHAEAWSRIWDVCGIDLEARGTEETLLKLRVHIFHLLQTVSCHSIDLDVGVPPRGWHGEAYRGHIFWDELFIFPFLSLRLPVLTRALLLYRYRRLPAARRLAREAGYQGAMYPWQSGSDGREESQRLHLNPASGRWIPDDTHRQRHINAAIAYNLWQYYQVTEDREFLADYGAEMLLEIARFWASIAEYDPADDRYDIRHVMGPDEFHTAYPEADPEKVGGLDNNAYTNLMAAWVLVRAQDVLDVLPGDRCRALRRQLDLGDEELEHWESVSRKLRLCFHDGDVLSQFEGYERLEEFDWDGYRERYGDIQRIDRILEAEGDDPNRYKASKQADVLMLFYLFSTEELGFLFERLGYATDEELVPRTVSYYLSRTSHGSTLSWVVHAWVLARADRGRSWQLFQSALDSDIADIQGGTTPEGIHVGAMAGTVDLMQRCYAGFETRGNVLHFNPDLPEDLERVSFPLHYRGHRLQVDIDHDTLTLRSLPRLARPITVAYRGRVRELAPGGQCFFRLLRPVDRKRAGSGQHGGNDRRASISAQGD